MRDAALAHFLRYITDTGAGEIYDILLGTRDIARVEEADISRMYTLKTTRYTFEAPLVLGALLAGVDDDHLRELAELIEPVGLAFQIQNDLIEYQQFKGVDRLRQTDMLEGKKTLLLRAAYDHLDRCRPQLPPALPEHAHLQRRLGQQDRAAHRQVGRGRPAHRRRWRRSSRRRRRRWTIRPSRRPSARACAKRSRWCGSRPSTPARSSRGPANSMSAHARRFRAALPTRAQLAAR